MGSPLTSGGDDGHLVVGKIANLFFRNLQVFRNINESQVLGYAHIGDHASSIESHFSTERGREGNNLLNPGDIGSETGNNDSSPAFPKQIFQRFSHFHLAQRKTFFFRIGGIGEQVQNSLPGQMGETDHIRVLRVHWSKVDPEIAGVDQYAFGRVDGKTNAVHDAVIYTDILDLERAEICNVSLADLPQISLFQQLMFFKLFTKDAQRKARTKNGNMKLPQKERHRRRYDLHDHG